MTKIIKLFKALLCTCMLFGGMMFNPMDTKANDRAVVCQEVTGYLLKSKSTYVIFDTVKPVQNATSVQQTYPISLTRSKSTTYGGTLNFEIIEDIIGFSAEVSVNDTKEVTIGQEVTVPKKTTYYAAFGSQYVTAEVQKATINLDCSKTWSGPIYKTTYTYEDYIGTYEIKLEKDKTYSISYLDSLNLE